MKLKRLAYLAFTFSIPCFLQAQQAKMNIGIEAGQLNFDVSFKGQPVILSSPLGMNIDNHLLGKEVKNSTVSTTSGKYKTYTIEQKDGNTYYIDSWEFDDGVALRYRIPSDGPRCIYGEQTAYTFPSGAPTPSKTNCWLLPPHSFYRTEPMLPSRKPTFSISTELFYSAKKTTAYNLAM